MLGVVILTDPNFTQIDFNKYPNFFIGVLYCLGSSVSSGFAYLMMRKMGNSIHSTVNPMWFGTFSVLMSYVTAAVF
jgi:drug/metabolite transporter (DMT)-like permease